MGAGEESVLPTSWPQNCTFRVHFFIILRGRCKAFLISFFCRKQVDSSGGIRLISRIFNIKNMWVHTTKSLTFHHQPLKAHSYPNLGDPPCFSTLTRTAQMGTEKGNQKLKSHFYFWSWSLGISWNVKAQNTQEFHISLLQVAFKKIWWTTVLGSHTTSLTCNSQYCRKDSRRHTGGVLTESDDLFVCKWVWVLRALITLFCVCAITFKPFLFHLTHAWLTWSIKCHNKLKKLLYVFPQHMSIEPFSMCMSYQIFYYHTGNFWLGNKRWTDGYVLNRNDRNSNRGTCGALKHQVRSHKAGGWWQMSFS